MSASILRRRRRGVAGSGGSAPDAPSGLALVTPTSTMNPKFDALFTDLVAGDVVRLHYSSVSNGSGNVDSAPLTSGDIAAGVATISWGTFPVDTYDFTMLHGRGGVFSVPSNTVHVKLNDAQATVIFNNTTAMQAVSPGASPKSFPSRALPNGHVGAFFVLIYNQTSAIPLTVTVDGRPCTMYKDGAGAHYVSWWKTDDVCISASGTVQITYPGTPVSIIISDLAQADNLGVPVGSWVSYAGSGSNAGVIDSPDKGCVLIASFVAGGTASITWPGSNSGTNQQGLKINSKNVGNLSADPFTCNPGAYHFDWALAWSNG